MNPQLHPFPVGGEWRSPSEQTATISSPYDASAVGTVALARDIDIEDAIVSALHGFEETRILSSYQRAECLSALASLIAQDKEPLADLLCREVGKPIQFARVEVDRAVFACTIAAEEAKRISGEILSLDLASHASGRSGMVKRFPLGIILAITPFNFPLNLVIHKIAPAMASGNAFILKPAPQAPLTSLHLARLIEKSGYPKRAWSVLPCTNERAEYLVKDERIQMLSFTGSPNVGWYLKSQAGRKKVVLELGGNAGVIVDRTAQIDEAVRKNALGAFFFAGQVCIKVQRIYIQTELFDEYREKFLEVIKSIKYGDPMESDTVLGPVIDLTQADRIERWISEAIHEGATLLAGGKRIGTIIEPTIMTDVPRTAKIFQEEIFGPVVTLHRFSTLDEAIAGVNDSSFGLQAGIFSNDFKNIFYAFNALDVGAVIVNDNPTFRIDHMPYGGVKHSGFGREGIKYAIQSMTEPKMLVFKG
ncbi:MAG: aldehyde dehydrogenase family protein [bacterium]